MLFMTIKAGDIYVYITSDMTVAYDLYELGLISNVDYHPIQSIGMMRV